MREKNDLGAQGSGSLHKNMKKRESEGKRGNAARTETSGGRRSDGAGTGITGGRCSDAAESEMSEGRHSDMPMCPVQKKCGGCQFQGIPYAQQLKIKQRQVEKLLKPFGKVNPIIGMENPYYYRNKVHAVFGRTRNGEVISGTYQENTHKIIPVEQCLIEDQKSAEIIRSIRGLLKSFKIRTYDEDTGYGLLRHVLVRRGFQSRADHGRSGACKSDPSVQKQFCGGAAQASSRYHHHHLKCK